MDLDALTLKDSEQDENASDEEQLMSKTTKERKKEATKRVKITSKRTTPPEAVK